MSRMMGATRAGWQAIRIVCAVVTVAALMPAATGAQESSADALARQARRFVYELPANQPHAVRVRETLQRLYDTSAAIPLWIAGGRLTRQADEVIGILADAHRKGLRSSDYDVDTLRGAIASAGARAGAGRAVAGLADAQVIAELDVSLSRAVARFLADLHMGHVDPRTLRVDLPDTHGSLDLASLVRSVASATDVAATVAAAEPPYPGYAGLIEALAEYRRLAADSGLRAPSRLPTALRPGASYAEAALLRRLLVALGDIDRDAPIDRDSTGTELYAGALVDGVAAFQRRHGLDADGVIGRATMAQLRVPMAARVRQIELTLERWRWMPDRPPVRYAVVNVPAFRLTLFESDITPGYPTLDMAVIVGQADGSHHTPLFSGMMREVVFRPYWDVPPSIARRELLPIIRRNPSYLVRNAFEIVRGGDEGATIFPPTAANLALIEAGTLRLRQRPGPGNALGLVKFVFPNRYNVYLHGTPEQQLFARARRDFSHGCVRIEDPTRLAELALRHQPEWTLPAIEQAMQGERTVRVQVARPITVYVLYGTAVAGEDGRVYFHDDLYGHDRKLARALGLTP